MSSYSAYNICLIVIVMCTDCLQSISKRNIFRSQFDFADAPKPSGPWAAGPRADGEIRVADPQGEHAADLRESRGGGSDSWLWFYHVLSTKTQPHDSLEWGF